MGMIAAHRLFGLIAAKPPAPETDRAMGDLNTTPLIDVMLCLLVMMILSIPVQTHSVKLDLPAAPQFPTEVVRLDHNDLAITAEGAILWNNAAISFDEMQHRLIIMRNLDPTPELRFQPAAEARYALVDSVIAAIKRANINAVGFTGNEQYRDIF